MPQRPGGSVPRTPAHPRACRSPFARLRGALAAIGLAAAFAGCTPVTYLAQAGAGQVEIGWKAEPIREVVKDRDTPPRLRRLLWSVAAIKRFGERHGLRPTDSYATYTALDRPVAAWVVSACAPLAFEPKTWSFPVVGSVPYLGWFDEGRARAFAADLRREGWDVDVRGAAAYSTLGWFQDPVLSTMIPDGDEALGDLANTVLHESVHATFYVGGQSVLNESVANFIGDRLAERWLAEESGASAAERQAYQEMNEKAARRAAAKQEAYRALSRLYASARPAPEKLAEKRRVLAALERAVEAKRPINNASLAQFKAYNAGMAELEALLAACGQSFPRMLSALQRLGPGDFAEPQQDDLRQVILPLVRAGCR